MKRIRLLARERLYAAVMLAEAQDHGTWFTRREISHLLRISFTDLDKWVRSRQAGRRRDQKKRDTLAVKTRSEIQIREQRLYDENIAALEAYDQLSLPNGEQT